MKKLTRYIILCQLILICFNAFSQQKAISPIRGENIPFKVYKSDDKNVTISDILKGNYSFKNPNAFTKKTCPDDIYWIRLDLKNDVVPLNSNEIWHLKFNAFDYGEMYYLCDDSLTIKPIGVFNKKTESERVKSQKYFSQVTFYPDTFLKDSYLYLKVRRVSYFEDIKEWQFTYHPIATNNVYEVENLKNILPVYFFIGISTIMSLLMFLFYVYLKRVEFFYNGFYVFWLLVLIAKDELLIFISPYFDNMLLATWSLENSVIIVGIGYMLFMIHYLDLKRDYIFAYRVLKISIALHISILIVDIFFYNFEYFHGRIIINELIPILDSITAFLSVGYILLFYKNIISLIFAAGSIIFMSGVGLYYHLDNNIDPLNYNKIYIIVGSAIEIMIFAFGLSYKVQSEQLERLRFQEEAFINKTKALRAQINPHFIFNALGSIQYLITSDNKMSALKYLSKFSRFTRNVLETSTEDVILLSEEITILNDYLEIESLRFKDLFTYKINISDEVEPGAIEIPILVVQPFVENAIIHGLLNKKNGEKKLSVDFFLKDNFLICEVEDNGVGRNFYKDKKSIRKRKSMGLEVTTERLEMFNQASSEDNIKIIDKVSEDGNALGTKVIIQIVIR